MTKSPISLQDLRRRIDVKAKAESTWCFWGLYVHICKMETLQAAAPGIDGITFDVIEESGVESFLKQIQDELVRNTYQPMPVRKREIPKDGGNKVRVLSIPTIRDRVVQGALKLILEPIFEADFQSGSYGYRPKRSAHEAVDRVAQAIVQGLTRIIDLDLRAYFDSVQPSLLLEKVARRVQDRSVMKLLKMILKSTGTKGVPQGGVISPMLSNLYRTEVDRMLEKAIATTRRGKYLNVQYSRFADDMVVLIDSRPRHAWLLGAVEKRLREELAKLRVDINEEKSRTVDLSKGESFGFLGFEYRRIRSRKGKWRAHYVPKPKKRTALPGGVLLHSLFIASCSFITVAPGVLFDPPYFCCSNSINAVRLWMRSSSRLWFTSSVRSSGPQSGMSIVPCAWLPVPNRSVIPMWSAGYLPLLRFASVLKSGGGAFRNATAGPSPFPCIP